MGRSIDRIEELMALKTVPPQPWCPTRGPADYPYIIIIIIIIYNIYNISGPRPKAGRGGI